ncbi:MAG: CPBP family intramembrane metalloprotease [Candidatus Obscuribacterales bacterium]|nr:CPBP family intramembrane metalloprotease [Candidatus Obscuribacterales bacterium]
MQNVDNDFLKLARLGKFAAWRYSLGLLIILLSWLLAGIVILVVSDPSLLTLKEPKKPDFQSYIALQLSFIPLSLSTALVTKFLLGRSWLTLVSPELKFDFKKIVSSFWIFLPLCALAQLIGYLLAPSQYVYCGTWNVLLQLPAVILTVFIQASAEELFFRGYLLQWMSLLSRNTVFLSCFNGLLFGIGHLGNPEISSDALVGVFVYVSVGFFFSFITLLSRNLNLSIGCHVAANVFAASLVNYKDGTLATASLFSILHSNSVFELCSFIAVAGAALLIFRKLGYFGLNSKAALT